MMKTTTRRAGGGQDLVQNFQPEAPKAQRIHAEERRRWLAGESEE